MDHNENQDKKTFSRRGAWLGLLAYIALIILIVIIFKLIN
jgi:hypothetical protein